MKTSRFHALLGLALVASTASLQPVFAQTAAPAAPAVPVAPTEAKPEEPPVVTTKSGLKIQDLVVGTGDEAVAKK